MLPHPDSHCGARPASNRIDPTRHSATFRSGGSWGQQRWIRNQRNGVERDADGIEDGCEECPVRIEQKQTRYAKRKKRGDENRRETPATQKPSARQRRGKMQQAVCPEMKCALPGSSLERRRVLDNEECSRVQPHKRSEAAEDAKEGNCGPWAIFNRLEMRRRRDECDGRSRPAQ